MVQVDLNRGIKEGLILLWLMKQLMKKESKIHNAGFLISPTTHLFPLVGQSVSHGVSSMINLNWKFGIMQDIIKLYNPACQY